MPARKDLLGVAREAVAEAKATKCESIILAYLFNSKRDCLSLTEAVEVCDACGMTVSRQTLKSYVTESSLLKVENPNPKRCVITVNAFPIEGA